MISFSIIGSVFILRREISHRTPIKWHPDG